MKQGSAHGSTQNANGKARQPEFAALHGDRKLLLKPRTVVSFGSEHQKPIEMMNRLRTLGFLVVACCVASSVAAKSPSNEEVRERVGHPLQSSGTTVKDCPTGMTCTSDKATVKGSHTHTFSASCESNSCPKFSQIQLHFSDGNAFTCFQLQCGEVGNWMYYNFQCTNWFTKPEQAWFTIQC